MNCAEAYVRFLCQRLLDKCVDDMEFTLRTEQHRRSLLGWPRTIAARVTPRTAEAVAILEEAVSRGHKFENREWGIDLASQHEKYLTETKYESHVTVYRYPKGIKAFDMKVNPDKKTVAAMDVLVPKTISRIKAFYMKINPDKKTIAAMDVLVPKVGELIGGSQR
nr:asparagine--tRNA ligase, cytoplasmic 1-like [Tanacetum cinerariifolium]